MKNATSLDFTPRLVLGAATAADLMTPTPQVIPASATVKEAATFLADRGFSAAPVVDEAGRPVGVLSQSDILAHERGSIEARSRHPKDYDWSDLMSPGILWSDVVNGDITEARDLMTPSVFSVAPTTSTQKVIEYMLDLKVHRLFVVDSQGALVGVITSGDVLRHIHPEEGWAESDRSPRLSEAANACHAP